MEVTVLPMISKENYEDADNHDQDNCQDIVIVVATLVPYLISLTHEKKTTLPLKVAPETRLFSQVK